MFNKIALAAMISTAMVGNSFADTLSNAVAAASPVAKAYSFVGLGYYKNYCGGLPPQASQFYWVLEQTTGDMDKPTLDTATKNIDLVVASGSDEAKDKLCSDLKPLVAFVAGLAADTANFSTNTTSKPLDYSDNTTNTCDKGMIEAQLAKLIKGSPAGTAYGLRQVLKTGFIFSSQLPSPLFCPLLAAEMIGAEVLAAIPARTSLSSIAGSRLMSSYTLSVHLPANQGVTIFY